MGIFGARVPTWQSYGPLGWDDVRVLMPGLNPMDDHTKYLLDQVYRTRQLEYAWRDALAATEDLYAQLIPLLKERSDSSVDEAVMRQALATGYILALEDLRWGTGQKEGMIHTATHNAICLLRHELPADQLSAGNRVLEAGYYLGRTARGDAIDELLAALAQ